MATNRPDRPSRALAYLESRKNLTGSACGVAGVALTFTGVAGPYWPAIVAALYAAGALIAPPERPPLPAFSPSAQQDALRADLTRLGEYVDGAQLPQPATELLSTLTALLTALLAEDWSTDPESFHTLTRTVRQDIPEAVDTYTRTRWWNRLAPGTEPPENHLTHQLTLIHGELSSLAAALRESEARRQETHTRYLEERNRPPAP
ncbi:hypothetical protein [Streptomyces sp. NPDC050738]|uniref:hypothetical protein n=1 Tax=Streptomyces sp. NPDC050738 TaxID=3154744 RepID=UPI003440C81D